MNVARGSNLGQSILEVRLRVVGVDSRSRRSSDRRLISPFDLGFRFKTVRMLYAVFVNCLGRSRYANYPEWASDGV